MRFRILLIAVQIVMLSSVVFRERCPAASIVDLCFVREGETVAEAVFWGPDGGPQTESTIYWDRFVRGGCTVESEQLKPDQADGNLATLKGPVRVFLVIRNQFCMGAIEMEGVTFEKSEAKAMQWNLTSASRQRVKELVRSNLMKTVVVEYRREYHTLARTIYIGPAEEDVVAADYWNLLKGSPDHVRQVSNDLENEEGNASTLEGQLFIEITPYPWAETNGNADRDGVIATRSLKLIRDSADDGKWHLSEEECRRIIKLVGKRPDRRTSGRSR